ncbi:hypothetical protein X946_2901 [Burkholderia sp. ABCPW 111]|nr:hypothetical protein X946_2901 [Burkholderia sp. ABCPW 111]
MGYVWGCVGSSYEVILIGIRLLSRKSHSCSHTEAGPRDGARFFLFYKITHVLQNDKKHIGMAYCPCK